MFWQKQSFAFFSMVVIASATASATTIAQSNRVYLKLPNVNFYNEEFGAGKITKLYPDGTVDFVNDANPGRNVVSATYHLSRNAMAFLKPKVSCDLEGKNAYSKDTFKQMIDYGIGKPQEIGYGKVVEVFGDCANGIATFKSAFREAPPGVSIANLMKPVNCDYLEKHGYTSGTRRVYRPEMQSLVDLPLGFGVANEAYGNCKDGYLVFSPDELPGKTIIPANSFKVDVNGVTLPEAQAQEALH